MHPKTATISFCFFLSCIDWSVKSLSDILIKNTEAFDYKSELPAIDLSVMPSDSIALEELNFYHQCIPKQLQFLFVFFYHVSIIRNHALSIIIDSSQNYVRTNLENGDTIYANTGDTIGKSLFVQDNPLASKTSFQKSVAILKPDRIE